MLDTELMAVVYGLASAAAWGAGDFSGGFATRHDSAFTVTIISQAVGMIILIITAMVVPVSLPPSIIIVYAALAGATGAFGLVLFYSGLARGRMGIVAPISAVVTAILPVLVGIWLEGMPSWVQLAGFGVAFGAVWLLSWSQGAFKVTPAELGLSVGAGICFGLFFIFIGLASEIAIIVPLIVAKLIGITSLIIVARLLHKGGIPAVRHLPVIFLAGIFDVSGNSFFALAARTGRLDIAAVLSSLYPATTVLLAWLILKETMRRQQWFGLVAALAALVLISF